MCKHIMHLLHKAYFCLIVYLIRIKFKPIFSPFTSHPWPKLVRTESLKSVSQEPLLLLAISFTSHPWPKLVRFAQYVHIFTYKHLLEMVYFLLSKFFKSYWRSGFLGMPSMELESMTSPLPRECSTAELQGQY